MGLFSKKHEDEVTPHLAPSPSPQYINNQSLPQSYPPPPQYYQPTPSPSGLAPGAYPPQEQYPPHQQTQPQYLSDQYPPRAPSPSGHINDPHVAYRASSPSAFPTPEPRILHITREGFSQKKARIYESDNRTQAYEMKTSSTAEWSNSKPNTEITSASTGQVVGTINFRIMSSKIEIGVNGRTIQLESNGWFTRGYSFASCIGPLKWEGGSIMKSTYTCTTERGEWLAKCDQKIFTSMHGKGTIEIVNRSLRPDLMEELVLTGLAMIENERREAKAAAGAAG
ncbi:MAG: hypothetical protein Q9171_003746 [Xanthocarpia ochracea]